MNSQDAPRVDLVLRNYSESPPGGLPDPLAEMEKERALDRQRYRQAQGLDKPASSPDLIETAPLRDKIKVLAQGRDDWAYIAWEDCPPTLISALALGASPAGAALAGLAASLG
jgi:hypothetical protein